MYGDGRNKGSAERARKIQKALDRKEKRTGRQLSGRDKARYQRAEGTADSLVMQGVYDQDDD